MLGNYYQTLLLLHWWLSFSREQQANLAVSSFVFSLNFGCWVPKFEANNLCSLVRISSITSLRDVVVGVPATLGSLFRSLFAVLLVARSVC